MARHLIQASYSSAGIADQVRNPQDRAEAVGPMIEGLGGTMEGFYLAFGDYDDRVIVE